MIAQNNYSALVFLAVVILAGAVVLGLLLTNTEVFNPSKAVQEANAYATKNALDARERSGILQATETPRALQVAVQQTQTAGALNATQTRQAAIAQATAIPVQQTATQVAIQSALGVAQANATQTALAVKAHNEVLQAQATQTRIAQEQAANAQQAQATATSIAGAIVRDADERNNANTRETLLTIALAAAIVAMGVGGAALLAANANAKANAAAAMLEREKRHTLQVRGAMQARSTAQVPNIAVIRPLPTRVPKNGHGEEEKIAV
jgi:hypothetical protein